MEKIPCPLCFEHQIDRSALKNKFLFFGHHQFEIKFLSFALCPLLEKEVRENPCLVSANLVRNFKVSIFQINESLRFIFENSQGKSASYLYSPDEAIEVLDHLKIALTAAYLELIKQSSHKLDRKTKQQRKNLVLPNLNRQLGPFYKAIRSLRRGL